jgi:hypothetical protein
VPHRPRSPRVCARNGQQHPDSGRLHRLNRPASKKAILIVESPGKLEDQGRDRWRRQQRRRAFSGCGPILMTSLAFIFGVVRS